jgi:hypothetical protein
MVKHLVNAQCLYPIDNLFSAATVIAADTNYTGEHYQEGRTQYNEQRYVR